MKKSLAVSAKLTACLLVSFVATGLVSAQDGGVKILNHKEEVFLNKNCKKTNTCDLKKVEYFVEDYRVTLKEGYNYGTRFFARYETNSKKILKSMFSFSL